MIEVHESSTSLCGEKGRKSYRAFTCVAGGSKGEGNGHEVQGLKWFEYGLANQWEVECEMCKSVCSLETQARRCEGNCQSLGLEMEGLG